LFNILDREGKGEVDISQLGRAFRSFLPLTITGSIMREFKNDLNGEELDEILEKLDINGNNSFESANPCRRWTH
jgi:Ca2+-binding EF-hand superfamily protein